MLCHQILTQGVVFGNREFVQDQKYKTEAEEFGWSFVFEDFVPENLKKKVTQKLEVKNSTRY